MSKEEAKKCCEPCTDNDNTHINHYHENTKNTKPYAVPANYNPNDYPAVRLREKRIQDILEQSATERKRRSKNRLSQRRSTGPVFAEDLEQATGYLDPYNQVMVVQ